MITKNRITQIASLSQKKARMELREFVCEGQRACIELLDGGYSIKELYYTAQANIEVLEKIENAGVRVESVTSQEMSRLSQLKTPSDMLAVCVIAQMPEIGDLSSSLSIALDCVQDPGNLGTIVRIADWFGIKTILCSKDCADIFSPKVVQATMGAITRVEVHYVDIIQTLSDLDIPIYGTFLDGESIYETTFTESGIIVMGNEGQGISKPIEKLVNKRLFIPPHSCSGENVESLNVAVATAICVAEFRRPTNK